MKNIWLMISWLLFILTGLFTIYSLGFPFEAGDWRQGLWFGMIMLMSPLGLVLAAVSRKNTVPRYKMAAIIGNLALMLFLLLYMTAGVLILGV